MRTVEQSTGRTPPALIDKPEYPEAYDEYIQAFYLLSNSRQIGMAVGAIPLTEIEAYCRMFDVFDIELFVALITSMDMAFMTHMNKKRDRA